LLLLLLLLGCPCAEAAVCTGKIHAVSTLTVAGDGRSAVCLMAEPSVTLLWYELDKGVSRPQAGLEVVTKQVCLES
jgi:hypothetical protein